MLKPTWVLNKVTIKPKLKLTRRIPVFFLNGGIGNQLFGYAAGKAYSQINNTPVKFDLSDVGKGFTNHGSSIQVLSLEIEIAPSKSKFQRLTSRIFNKLNRLFFKLTGIKPISINNYSSHEIGYDAEILEKRFIRSARGYFQSWKFVEIAKEIFPPGDSILKTPSRWFSNMSGLAKIENPIMVHVRRGDYKKLSDTYGLLSAGYYVAALEKVRNVLPLNPIWVFSDNIDEAKAILSPVFPIETNWVKPPLDSDPVESLVLMSFGAANIIGNSTFSWWSAMLNKNSVVTISPQKWFKGMNDPKDLYPQSWTLVPSTWEN